MSAIAALLARAKANTAPRIDSPARIALTRRVRPVDRSCAAGGVVSVDADGWTFWIGDDRIDHFSAPDYIEPETP